MKTLIAYFSWSNNTKQIVEDINKIFNFDILRIQKEVPYSSDYNTCAYIEAKEEWEKKLFPKIKESTIDISTYDEILLFFPIWWYTFPRPIATFIKEDLANYKGKVILFANSYTNDPQYVENSIKDLKEINDKLDIEFGLFNKNIDEHITFINKEIK